MAHTYSSNYIHMVFSTAQRLPTIPADRSERLYEYIAGIGRKIQVRTVAAGGTANHVHLLLLVPTKISIAEAANKIKSNSSRWLSRRFAWQTGYGVFSVSPSQIASVERYIRTQAEHHAKRTFEEEYIALLEKCGLPYDPADVF